VTHTSTHTYATLDVSEATYVEIARKLRAAGYDHAFIDGGETSKVIDMHGIGLVTGAAKPILLRLVGTDADERVQHAADVVYDLAITHMTAGLRVANRLRAESGQKPLTVAEILTLLDVTPEL